MAAAVQPILNAAFALLAKQTGREREVLPSVNPVQIPRPTDCGLLLGFSL
jgi:hypothetical protein